MFTIDFISICLSYSLIAHKNAAVLRMKNRRKRRLLVDIYSNGLMVDQGGKINDEFRHETG